MQPVQFKMACAALDLSADDLAHQADLPADVLQALRNGDTVDPSATTGLHLFLSSHGIELIEDDGVRARPQMAARSVAVEDLTTGNDGGQG